MGDELFPRKSKVTSQKHFHVCKPLSICYAMYSLLRPVRIILQLREGITVIKEGCQYRPDIWSWRELISSTVGNREVLELSEFEGGRVLLSVE